MASNVNNVNNDQTPPALPPANTTPTYSSLSAGVYALLSSVIELAQEAQVDNFKGVQTGIATRNASMTYMGGTGLEAAKWAFWGKIAEGAFAIAGGVTSIAGSAWNNRASSEIGQLSRESDSIENDLKTLKGNYGEAFNNKPGSADLMAADADPVAASWESPEALRLEAAASMNKDVNDLYDGIFTTNRTFNDTEKKEISETVSGMNDEQRTASKKTYDAQVTDQTTLLGAKRNQINTLSQNLNFKLDMAKQAINAGSSFVQAPLNQLSTEKQVESQLFGSQENVAGSTLQTAQSVNDALAKQIQDEISMIQSAFSAA
jgi:hypothetical protein